MCLSFFRDFQSSLVGNHEGRPACPGEGDLGKPDNYCYIHTNSIVKPRKMGKEVR